jgi:hypothetical protein
LKRFSGLSIILPDPDPAQNLDADPDPDTDPGGEGGEGGGRSAKNVHPPWQNPRYAPAIGDSNWYCFVVLQCVCTWCEFKSNKYSMIKKHVEIFHEKKNSYSCKECVFIGKPGYIL